MNSVFQSDPPFLVFGHCFHVALIFKATDLIALLSNHQNLHSLDLIVIFDIAAVVWILVKNLELVSSMTENEQLEALKIGPLTDLFYLVCIQFVDNSQTTLLRKTMP